MSWQGLTALSFCIPLILPLPRPLPAADSPEERMAQIEKLIESKEDADVPERLRQLRGEVEELLRSEPANPAHHHVLSKVLYHWGDEDAASLASASRAVELAPENAEYRHWKAKVLLAVGEPQKAIPELQKARELEPARTEHAALLVEALSSAKRTAEAKKLVGDLIRLEPKSPRWLGARAGVELDEGDEAAAERSYRSAVEVDPAYFFGWYNLGQLAQNRKRHGEALSSFERCVKLRPEDMKSRAKTIQCFQALSRLPERDRAREELLALHAAGKIRESLYCRDQFEVAGQKLIVVEYFKLEGDRAMRYSFNVVGREGKIDDGVRISLGSYEMTTQIAREAKTIGPDDRVFHLDRYTPRGHATFGMFKAEPSYDEVRKMVVEIFEGKREAQSSTTMDGGSQ